MSRNNIYNRNVGNLTNDMHENIPKNKRVALGAQLVEALNTDGCFPEKKLYKITNSKGKSGFKLREIITETPVRYRNYAKGSNSDRGTVEIAAGNEGIVYIGCLDAGCLKEIAIKKVPNPNINHNVNNSIASAKREFDNLKKIHTASDHVVTPYLFTKCKDYAYQYVEYFSGGNLSEWINNKNYSLRPEHFRNITFQIIFALKQIQEKYPSFRHNDLHNANILVNDKASAIGHTIYGNKKVKNIGVKVAIADLGFSTINNNHVYDDRLKYKHGMSGDNNKMYDVHYFLNAIYAQSTDPQLRQFIENVIGVDYLGNYRRDKIQDFRLKYPETKNTIFPTFDEILNHPYFDVYNKPNSPTKFKRPDIKQKKVNPTIKYNKNTILGLRSSGKNKFKVPFGLNSSTRLLLFPRSLPPAPRSLPPRPPRKKGGPRSPPRPPPVNNRKLYEAIKGKWNNPDPENDEYGIKRPKMPKRNNKPSKPVSLCGKSAKPIWGIGVERMTVSEMANFVLQKAPEDVKNMLLQLNKVSRSSICFLLQRFPEGRKLMPNYKSPDPRNRPMTPNIVRANRLIKEAIKHVQATGKINKNIIIKIRSYLSNEAFKQFTKEHQQLLKRKLASEKVANFFVVPKTGPGVTSRKNTKTTFVLPGKIRLTKNNIINRVEPLKWVIHSTLFAKLTANAIKASNNVTAATKAHKNAKTKNTQAILNSAKTVQLRANSNLVKGQDDRTLQLMAGNLARQQIKEQKILEVEAAKKLKASIKAAGLNSNSNSNSPRRNVPGPMVQSIINKLINNATKQKPKKLSEFAEKIKGLQNPKLKPTDFIVPPTRINLPVNPVAPPTKIVSPKKKTGGGNGKKKAALLKTLKGLKTKTLMVPKNKPTTTKQNTYSRNNKGRIKINPPGTKKGRLCQAMSKPDIEAYLRVKGIEIPNKINGKKPTKDTLCELLMA